MFTISPFCFVQDSLATRRKRDKTLKMKDRELFVDKGRWTCSSMVPHVVKKVETRLETLRSLDGFGQPYSTG